VASPLDHGKLEAKANTKKRSILLARPFDRQYHTFDAALAKPAWNEDTAERNMRTLTPSKLMKHYFAPTTVRHAS
jgi:hypothetical protein